ncbi:recombinase family protein [Clostridium sp. AF15-6B]|jgi:site-specific DNA recombinase|uniref:recombinase family protein n=1 Tax=Clostridium TaxID=1485 RepID=UPI000E53B10A|nr:MULTISPECIES: recombinase family protein [Clostridium]RGG97901.1 recombinase family protein [Clostridium sp. AF16-25]RGH02159.1 recombinase family protein [Clostridium sp. AF15-49]RGH08044.1 recombinase family protein [Clostridium sp. AF15-6B]DAL10974.1 MAG TPA_asm: integrase [Caudoviricetes sp.]RGH15608.1 recombinase family protein [Clostridium sp. AF12-41]
MNENEHKAGSVADQKNKIRERYKGVSLDELDVIPALPQEDIFAVENEQRVAVYARVSTDDPRQTSSYELQKNHYHDVISKSPNWKLVQIYADEGISGTSLQHRDQFKLMIEDCKQGKIDLIVTKSVSRFARNVVDCIGYVRELLALPHPVGVFFETERLNTFDPKSEMVLSFMATLAQEESHTKSEIMNASIEMRFRRGIFLTPILLGYDHDEDGNLVINEEEAKIVKLIFMMYLNGCTCQEIADTLTELGCMTKKGNTVWSPGSILQILQNERHCGDVLAHKTYTPNYLNHKSKKNMQNRPQYRKRNHHEAIISRDDFIAVQRLISNAKYGNKGLLPELKVIPEGVLKGFVSINPRWAGFKEDDYINASASVYNGTEQTSASSAPVEVQSGDFDLRGYEIARSQFFDSTDRITVTFSQGDIRFSCPAVRRLESTLVELLMHPQKRILAVRTAGKECRNAMQWSKKKSGVSFPRGISGTAFLPTLYSLLGWKDDCRYRITGIKRGKGNDAILLFNLTEPEIFIPNDTVSSLPESDTSVKPFTDSNRRNVRAYPPDWADTFGSNYYSHAQAQELAGFGKGMEPDISHASVIYKDNDIQVTSKDDIERNIEQIMSDMKENTDEHTDEQ